MAKTLVEILEENGWNGPSGTDKNTDHDYINSFYELEFPKYRNKKINILEIGTCRGTSVHLWQTYFPKANIIGIDIQDYILERHKNIDRVKYILDDAYSERVSSSLSDFDIIIDDGSHNIEDQVKVLDLYVDKIKKGGVLVIEDLQKFEYFEILSNKVKDNSNVTFECLDLRENKGRQDDMMFIIRRK